MEDQDEKKNTSSPKVKNDVTFDTLKQQLTVVKQQLTLLSQSVGVLEKNINKQTKQYVKDIGKNKNKGNRKPSGFAKPTPVTDELCVFMKKPTGTEIARTDVTQYLIKYIKENKLEDKKNKINITPDSSLQKLLGIDADHVVTYFNLQGLMNKHFVNYKVES